MVEANANNNGIPEKQWGLLVQAGGGFKIEEIDVPKPGPGQVLVKVECAPINPSDTYFMAGHYEKVAKDTDKIMTLPMVCGWEGSGTVVASGGGLLCWRLLGKRVAMTKCEEPNGTLSIGGCYQQYMITTPLQCMPLPDDVSFEIGAMHFVNPLTALGLLDRAKQYKAQACVQTAAASQLGRMINKLFQEEKIPLINIVRREEQAKILRDMGAEHILNQTDPDFLDQLQELAKKLKATVCYEAIAGNFTGQLMSRLPYGSKCILYGTLSEQDIGDIDALVLIGRNQRLESFLLSNYAKEKSLWALGGLIRRCQSLMRNKTLQSEVLKRISLFEVEAELPEYKKQMTLGKYIIYPQEKAPSSSN
eukprot:403373881